MQTMKSESFSKSTGLLSFDPPKAKPELDYWEHLIFSFDTDRHPGGSMADNNFNTRNTHRSRSASQGFTDATGSGTTSSQQFDSFSQLATTGSDLQGTSGGRLYDTYDMLAQTLREVHRQQGGYAYIPSYTYEHHHQSTQQYASSSTNPYMAPLHQSSPMGMNIQIHNYTPASQAGQSHSSSLSPDNSQGEDGVSVGEDKRRRNTAASARFRIKKKQRNLNLERTVSDLTGRAEELEREATELRRENGWLKEIVMLKGRTLRGTDGGDEGEGDNPADDDSDSSDDDATTNKNEKGKGKKIERAKK